MWTILRKVPILVGVRRNNIMLEIIQFVIVIVSTLAVGLCWGMFITFIVSKQISKDIPKGVVLGTIVWLTGIIMLVINMTK